MVVIGVQIAEDKAAVPSRKQSMTTILQDCHIIPRSLRNHAALQGLADFDIDAIQNRIYLPNDPELGAKMGLPLGMSGRDDVAYAAYRQGVEGVLDELAQIADPVARLREVINLQDTLKVALINGDVVYGSGNGGEIAADCE